MAGRQVEPVQVPVVVNGEVAEVEQEPTVVGELHIKLYDNGQLELFVPPTSKELSPEEAENLTYVVHKQLYEQRLVKNALDAFKSRLG